MNMTSLKSFVALHGIALLYILSFAVLCYGTDQIPFGQIHNRALLQVNSTVNANGTANNNGNQTVVDPGPTNPPNDLDKVNEVIRKVGDAKLGNCSIWAGIGGGCNKKYTSSDVTVSAAINFVLGFLCFLGFGILRKHVKVYKARLVRALVYFNLFSCYENRSDSQCNSARLRQQLSHLHCQREVWHKSFLG